MVDHNMDVHQKVFKEAKKETKRQSLLAKRQQRRRASTQPKLFKCEKGDFATNSEQHFREHEKRVHELKCDKCERVFVTHKVYARHYRDHSHMTYTTNSCQSAKSRNLHYLAFPCVSF